jgi:hypothetical protein
MLVSLRFEQYGVICPFEQLLSYIYECNSVLVMSYLLRKLLAAHMIGLWRQMTDGSQSDSPCRIAKRELIDVTVPLRDANRLW